MSCPIIKVFDKSWIKFADTADIYISSDVLEIDIDTSSNSLSLYDSYKYNYLKYFDYLQQYFNKKKFELKITKYAGDIFLVSII